MVKSGTLLMCWGFSPRGFESRPLRISNLIIIMNLKEYQKFCKLTANTYEDKEKEILTWGLGLIGEAGDAIGCIKKTYSQGEDQISGIRENLGDVMWYIAMICNYYNWNMDDLTEENIEKLKKRYPNGFKKEDARRGGTRVDWMEK